MVHVPTGKGIGWHGGWLMTYRVCRSQLKFAAPASVLAVLLATLIGRNTAISFACWSGRPKEHLERKVQQVRFQVLGIHQRGSRSLLN